MKNDGGERMLEREGGVEGDYDQRFKYTGTEDLQCAATESGERVTNAGKLARVEV